MIPDRYVLCTPAIIKNIRNPLIFLRKMATYVLSKNRKKIRRKTIMSNPIVTITMENGDVMKAELYPEIAPNTVNNFISLVKKASMTA